jgi:hypothetical protein
MVRLASPAIVGLPNIHLAMFPGMIDVALMAKVLSEVTGPFQRPPGY